MLMYNIFNTYGTHVIRNGHFIAGSWLKQQLQSLHG